MSEAAKHLYVELFKSPPDIEACEAGDVWEYNTIKQALDAAHSAGRVAGLRDAAKRFKLAFERNDVAQDVLDWCRQRAQEERA